jgi:putative transposase
MRYKSNCNITYSCKYHVVWCPKYRRKVLVNGVDERLKAIVREVIHDTRSELIEMEVVPDHVHILVEVDPSSGFTASSNWPTYIPHDSFGLFR